MGTGFTVNHFALDVCICFGKLYFTLATADTTEPAEVENPINSIGLQRLQRFYVRTHNWRFDRQRKLTK
jgi:hypothetical protein